MKIVLLYTELKDSSGKVEDIASIAYGPFINYQVAHHWYDANKPNLQKHDQFDIIDYRQIIS